MPPSQTYSCKVTESRPLIISRHTDTATLRQIGPWRLKERDYKERSKSEGCTAYSILNHDEFDTTIFSFSETIRKIDEECSLIDKVQSDYQSLNDEPLGPPELASASPSNATHSHQISNKQLWGLLLAFLSFAFLTIITTTLIMVSLMYPWDKFYFITTTQETARNQWAGYILTLASSLLSAGLFLTLAFVMHLRSPTRSCLKTIEGLMVTFFGCFVHGTMLAGYVICCGEAIIQPC